MPIIFYIPPWSAMWLMLGLCYFRFHAEMFSAEFTSFLGESQLEGEKMGNIRQKYNGTESKITKPPLKLDTVYQGGIWKIIGTAIFFIKCLTGY